MTERYDFETVKKSETDPAVVRKGEWIVLMYSMSTNGGTYIEYPPVPAFYKIVKFFYPNGNLKSMGKVTGQNLKFGMWQYYDEKGDFFKEEDENKKFGKIKVDDILKFLEKEGLINLTSGEGREFPIVKENKYVGIEECRFSLSFVNDNEGTYWNVFFISSSWNNNNHIIYHIDINTGEVLSKKIIHSPIEI